MTSIHRRTANRANARLSTGPRTVAGRQRVSRNAFRHGLTTPPDEDVVAALIEIISDDPALDDREVTFEEVTLATNLAEAEACLDRVRRAEERFLEDYHALDRGDVHLEKRLVTETIHAVYRAQPQEYWNGRWHSGGHEIASERKTVGVRTKHTSYEAELRRLLRYRREAEVARLRALKAWIRFLKDSEDSETKPTAEGKKFDYPSWLPRPEPQRRDPPPTSVDFVATNIRHSGDFDHGMPDSATIKLPFRLLY